MESLGYIGSMSLELPTWAVGGPLPPKPLARPDPPEPKAKKSVATEPKMETDDPDAETLFGETRVQVPEEIAVLSNTAFLGDRDFLILTSAQLLAQMPKEERVLRTTFVREYLYDFDPLLAAIRTGFLNVRSSVERHSPAMNAARALMAEPVVQRLIKECMLEAVNAEDAETSVLTMLFREATNHSQSGNAAARNTSYKMLLEAIERREATKEGKDKVKGNVMAIPMLTGDSDSDWEKKAMSSQKALKESVRA